VKGML